MRIRPSVLLSLVVILVFLILSGCSRDSTPTADETSDQAVEQVADTDTASPGIQSEETDLSSAPGVEAGVVAYVNNMPVSSEVFERSRQQVLSRYQQVYSQFGQDVLTLLGGAQGRLFGLRIDDEALEIATTRALVVEELNRRDVPITEDEVEAEFQKQYAEFLSIFGMSEQEFQEAFEAGELVGFETGNLSFDQFIDYAKQTVREEFEVLTVQRLIAGQIEHTGQELIAFFEEHLSEYDIAEQVRASHILVATEELAHQLFDELSAGADFATLAQEHSTDTGSAPRGGDLGWFGRGQMVEPFEEAAFNTPTGELSDIVQTQYGYHIIWTTDYQPEEKPEYEDVADLVTSDFESDVMAQQFNQWYSVARSTAGISVEDLMLDAYRKQQVDTDQGLQAFIKLREEDEAADPYLDYIIGTIYETKMDEAQSEKLGIEGNETIAPSQQDQIDALETEIETNRILALASYRAALARLGENVEIEARIQVLDPSEEIDPTTE